MTMKTKRKKKKKEEEKEEKKEKKKKKKLEVIKFLFETVLAAISTASTYYPL